MIREGKRIERELLKKYGLSPSELLLFKKPFYRVALWAYEKVGGLDEVTKEGDIRIRFREHPFLYMLVYLTPIRRPFSHFDGTLGKYSTLTYKLQDVRDQKWPIKMLDKDVLVLTRMAEKLRDDPGYIPILWIGEEDAKLYLKYIPIPPKGGKLAYLKNMVAL